MSEFTRRNFLQTSAGVITATSLLGNTSRADVNGKIRVAVLGVNGRGRTHVKAIGEIEGADVVLLCDPDQQVLAKRAAEFEKKYGRKVETETDMRKVFDRDDIDVVTVATPNHWHSLATIWACQAGKDVYVEKPGSHNLFEGRKMIEAAHKYKRIVQHGVQLRSQPAIQEAVEHLRKGTIGKVYMARGLVFRWRASIGNKPDEKAPAALDWNLWQGPAQETNFSRRLVHYNWHWTWDYGNGDVGNQGVHETDMCLWGLDVKLPSQITAMGGKFLWDDDKETPELLSTNYFYPDENKMIQFEVRPWNTNTEDGATVGNIFYGSEGYMVIKGYKSYEIFMGRKREPGPKNSGDDPVVAHFTNFLDAVRSRKSETLNGPVETAHTSSGIAHLGNIAYRLGRQLNFDPKTEQFVNDPEADKYLTRQYRKPFVVPNEV
ncbi:MAG: Gfo/Idh/MocA family oxidoreductase [Planctomycetes bacterium]|nr:Gfo/Idh/MocA family oxidoreductase [Planctomycetota bacterium]MCH9725253.1 Gfo/Idh/MocA family oxidoreductase [Planctomycetota bacterium]MCH9779527.1 Gfo/Idh/MocA family oxidoreductase [Planctomycetota bacterium]MCH9791629.1 Gfo/Idh/MocA family oxidoreductase [Planctomycetota bacterium]